MQKTIIAYVKEIIKQREQLDVEVAKLEKLLKENLIDENIHTRLNELLEIDYEQKRKKTREKYGCRVEKDAQALSHQLRGLFF
jgi:hypothetical protein